MKIKEARKAAGLTQGELAELLEVPLDTIKSWDCGRRYPPKWVENLILEKLGKIIIENLEKKRESVN